VPSGPTLFPEHDVDVDEGIVGKYPYRQAYLGIARLSDETL